MRERIDKLLFVDPEEFEKPRQGTMIGYLDHWWPVDSQGRIAFWQPRIAGTSYEYPQCNSNRSIALRLADIWVDEVIQIPVIIVPLNI